MKPQFFLVPRSVIAGGSTDIHVQEGSTINITCTVYDSVQPPAFFFWYHDGQVSIVKFIKFIWLTDLIAKNTYILNKKYKKLFFIKRAQIQD